MRCASFISYIRVCTVILMYNSSGREKPLQQISCVSDGRPSHTGGGRKQTLCMLALCTVGLLCTWVPPQVLWVGGGAAAHSPLSFLLRFPPWSSSFTLGQPENHHFPQRILHPSVFYLGHLSLWQQSLRASICCNGLEMPPYSEVGGGKCKVSGPA